MIIGLKNIRMRANHGIYEFEKSNGNDFIINAEIGFDAPCNIQNIEETLDYEVLLKCIEKHMKLATPLLETVVQNIEIELKEVFIRLNYYKIKIEKCSPPMDANIYSSYVSVKWRR